MIKEFANGGKYCSNKKILLRPKNALPMFTNFAPKKKCITKRVKCYTYLVPHKLLYKLTCMPFSWFGAWFTGVGKALAVPTLITGASMGYMCILLLLESLATTEFT